MKRVILCLVGFVFKFIDFLYLSFKYFSFIYILGFIRKIIHLFWLNAVLFYECGLNVNSVWIVLLKISKQNKKLFKIGFCGCLFSLSWYTFYFVFINLYVAIMVNIYKYNLVFREYVPYLNVVFHVYGISVVCMSFIVYRNQPKIRKCIFFDLKTLLPKKKHFFFG